MKKFKTSLLPFLVVVMVYLTGMFVKSWTVEMITKPLLVGSLLFYFLIEAEGQCPDIKLWMVLAMVFCILGDTLLMFDRGDEFFFVLGLVAFLIGHIFYIFAFRKIKKKNQLGFHPLKSLLVLVYMVVILWLLLPGVNELKVPVVFYAAVISIMLIFAVQLTKIGKFGWIIAIGALLFVISDSAIAINKFYTPIPKNGWIVTLTYIAAQFFIARGAVEYIQSTSKNSEL
ncbi:MAG TPA: lysoplasmalogenase [Treponemataceae bacterium]|nr:lysoplasmalogenase [Treponemataceae bacterium]